MPRKSNLSKSAFLEGASKAEQEFWTFALQVPVTSRDTGLGPIRPWGSQRELIRQIFLGLEDDVHQFVVTKGGQVGATLVLWLLDIWWMLKYPGLQGVFAADSDDVRDFGRDNIQEMAKAAPEFIPFRLNNRAQLVWENQSRFTFQTAGPRSGKKLGVGRGFAFCHGTEVALWGDPNAIGYLRTRFSDVHPQRLSVFESTARGRNWWYDVWAEAGDAADIRRIFLAWWLREDYALPLKSAAFKQYWNGRLTRREQAWSKTLAKRHQVELKPEQWAWRRWYVAEKMAGDERLADQEEPTVVEDAFEASGISFLSLDAIRRCRRTVEASAAPDRYRYEFGQHLEDTDLKKTIPGYGTLSVWEDPQQVDGYVVSAVPAYSATRECPWNTVKVWKATRDTLTEVAAFADEECGLQVYAWVCAHLVGAYAAPKRAFILETAGMGQGVLQELKRLQQSGWGTQQRANLQNVLGAVRHYLWRRPDSMTGSLALQWRSSTEMRTWLMTRLRDQIANGTVTIRDPDTLAELERVRQQGDLFVPEGKSASDHRVMNAALAVESWASQLVPQFQRVQGNSTATTVLGRTIEGFFNDLRRAPSAAGARR